MIFEMDLPWYISTFFLVIIFFTLLIQAYYCQILISVSLQNKFRIIMKELVCVVVLFLLAYLEEWRYGYVVFSVALPLLWWHIWRNYKSYRKIVEHTINRQTYKQAWDFLPIPVVIANSKREILLINEAMFAFLEQTLYKKVRNIQVLWHSLEQGVPGKFEAIRESGRLVLRLQSGESYWADLESFELDGEQYWQLTLTDITRQQELLHQQWLQSTDSDYVKGLRQLLDNLEEIKKQEVTEEVHGRVHDFMGQRIAILQRLLSQRDNMDFQQLFPMLEDVLQDMRTASLQSAEDQLVSIVDTFCAMGLNLRVIGQLPYRQDWALPFVNMLREGATNAVRHGEATEVTVIFEQKRNRARITITSNGRVPDSIQRGRGLRGIEKSLQALGGSLKIFMKDKFIMIGEVGTLLNENINS